MNFERDRPVETERPAVEVDGLKRVGEYRFELTVENERGQRSEPDQWVVLVERLT